MIDKKILQQNIILTLRLEALDDDKKIALLDKMTEVVQKRLTLKVIEQMTEEDKKEFEKLLAVSPDKVSDFLQKVFPNFIEIIQEEIIKLKQELTDEFKE